MALPGVLNFRDPLARDLSSELSRASQAIARTDQSNLRAEQIAAQQRRAEQAAMIRAAGGQKAYLEQLAQQQALATVAPIIQNDAAIQNNISTARDTNQPIADRQRALQELRTNLRTIARANGLDPTPLFNATFGKLRTDIETENRAVQDQTGLFTQSTLDQLNIGARRALTSFRAIGSTAQERRALDRQQEEYEDTIRANNAYLRDQRRIEERGDAISATGVGSALSNAAGILPDIAGVIGSSALGRFAVNTLIPGAARVAGAATPVGRAVSLASSLVGPAIYGAVTGAQDNASRIARDPRIATDAARDAAIDSSTGLAAAAGGVTTAIMLPAGGIGQFARGALPAALGRNAVTRGIGNVALSTADAAVGNVADVVSRNAIFENATSIDTPLTQGVGSALAISAGMGVPLGLARTRLGGRGVPVPEQPPATVETPTVEAAATSPPVAPAAPTAPRPAASNGWTETRSPERVNFDEQFRSTIIREMRDAEGNPTEINANTLRDEYKNQSNGTDADFLNFVDADQASANPLGNSITDVLRRTVQPEGNAASLTPDETTYLASLRGRILQGEDITFPEANAGYTGTRSDDTLFTQRIASDLAETYQARNAPAYAMHQELTRLGRGGSSPEVTIGRATDAVRKFYADGGSDAILDRYINDAGLLRRERSPYTPAPGKLTKAQQSILGEAAQIVRRERANVAGTAGPARAASVESDGQGGATGVNPRGTDVDSGVEGYPPGTVGAAAEGSSGTPGRSDTTAPAGRAGGITEPNQRAGETNDVAPQTEGTRTGPDTDTGRSAEPAATGLPEAGAGTRVAGSEGVGDASVTRNAEDAGGNRLADDGVITPEARQFMEENGVPPLSDEASARSAVNDTPLDVAVRSDIPTTDPLAIRNTLDNITDDRLLGILSGNNRPPTTAQGLNAARERGLDLLMSEALGLRLTPRQTRHLAALHEAGIPEMTISPATQANAANAQAMGLEVNVRQLVKAEIDYAETMNKVERNPWCR